MIIPMKNTFEFFYALVEIVGTRNSYDFI